jgi:beta-lactamase regulating signal transducer with metallopeptidase domain
LAAAEGDPREDLLWISSRRPLALLAGILRPRLVLSKSLRDHLAPEMLRAVVLHERAHARRHDVLRLAAASFLSIVHLPHVRRVLLQDLRNSCEQAADAEAASSLGDPISVAEAILAVGRLALDRRDELGVLARAFNEGALEERIQALLSPVSNRVPLLLRARTLLVGTLLLLLFGSDPLHHAVETLLAPLTH